MPKSLADGRTKLVGLTTAPSFTAPSAAALNAGVELSCLILKSDYRLSAVASDTINEPAMCAEGNAIVYGASNYEANLTVFRYFDDATGQPDPAEDLAWELLKEKGTTLWLVEREGPVYDQAFAAGDIVDIYEVITDNPQKPSDRTGYIKRTMQIGVQHAFNEVTVAA